MKCKGMINYLSGLAAILCVASANAKTAAPQAAIATASPLATKVGMQILQEGGNAFDAAIAVTAVLAVAEPYGSGIGGGGFYLLHNKKQNLNVMLDARETAPLAATADMYVVNGKVDNRASKVGALAAGIPGIPAAITHLAKKYGRLPLAKTLAPAIKIANEGFEVTERYQKMIAYARDKFSAEAATVFIPKDALELGDLIVQKDLAVTLGLMAKQGSKGFYQGKVAKKLLSAVKAKGGIWTQKDFDQYQVKERQPIQFKYHDNLITTVALPSSGGLVLAEMLHMLESYPLNKMDGLKQVHLLTEVMRRAYRDRAAYMGDNDFVDVPVSKLLNRYYAQGLAASIRMGKATPSEYFDSIQKEPPVKGQDTTHFSIMDKAGNRVAATLSINFPFGSGFMPAGTGVVLNNEMDDFSAQPGVANAYGLVGNDANAIEGGKRMLSSMTPTFVENDKRLAIVGTPGGSRIITMVMLGILKFTKEATADEIVTMPRFHHQYLPDVIQYETGSLSRDLQYELQLSGHRLRELNRFYGNMQIVIQDKATGLLSAASDPRGEGLSLVE